MTVEVFDNRESEYLVWVQANPHGFVATIDRTGRLANYPMVHSASHRLVSSPKIGNFTTGDYIKFCSIDLVVLERYAQQKFARPLTRCSQCM